jgi:hypothetical protein
VLVQLPNPLPYPAELVIPLDAKATRQLMTETIHLFHWDEAAEVYRLVPMSAVADDGEVVWGRIREGGTYVAVGYPRDPLVRDTVRLIELTRPYRRLAPAPELQAGLLERLCQVILCPPDFWTVPVEEAGNDWLVIPDLEGGSAAPGDGGRPRARRQPAERAEYLRSICDACVRLPPKWQLPEARLARHPASWPYGSPDGVMPFRWHSTGPRNITCVVSVQPSQAGGCPPSRVTRRRQLGISLANPCALLGARPDAAQLRKWHRLLSGEEDWIRTSAESR